MPRARRWSAAELVTGGHTTAERGDLGGRGARGWIGTSSAPRRRLLPAARQSTAPWPSLRGMRLSRSEARQADATLERIAGAVRRGELEAPAWFVERLHGARAALQALASRR